MENEDKLNVTIFIWAHSCMGLCVCVYVSKKKNRKNFKHLLELSFILITLKFHYGNLKLQQQMNKTLNRFGRVFKHYEWANGNTHKRNGYESLFFAIYFTLLSNNMQNTFVCPFELHNFNHDIVNDNVYKFQWNDNSFEHYESCIDFRKIDKHILPHINNSDFIVLATKRLNSSNCHFDI